MITNDSNSFGLRLAISLFLAAAIAGGYLAAIDFLNPGFVA